MYKLCILVAFSALLASCDAQIKNVKTQTIAILGNCGMCEKTIEKAGYQKKIAKVDWDKDTKMAILTFDSMATNADEILKRVALAGYDSDEYLAPDDTYRKLPECCQYERKAKVLPTPIVVKSESTSRTKDQAEPAVIASKQTPPLQSVFDGYFAVKDALVQTNGKLTASKAKTLASAAKAVKMEELSTTAHEVWMKVAKTLLNDAALIAETTEPEKQRAHFISLSKSIYDLAKVSKQPTPTYLQHCPMANDGKGADWLSREVGVKNPYYGSLMLTCGKTVEIIK